MDVKILDVITELFVAAEIKDAVKSKLSLPSLTDGWRFNFKKHSKSDKYQTYALVTNESPHIIEGCLIFELKNKEEPYMAYIEIAPHNKVYPKKYDHVAGCLIAYACRLSIKDGKGHFKGWLAFDVQEESIDDENKLMAMYAIKYHAKRWLDTTTMLINPADSEILITKYLS